MQVNKCANSIILQRQNKKFCAAEAKFGLVELGLVHVEPGGGGLIPIFFLRISSSWVNIRLHNENQL